MYVSLNGTLVAGRVPWPEFAQLAAAEKFPGVDVAIAPAMEQGLSPTRKLLTDLHLKPAVTGLPVEFRRDEETFRKGLEQLEAAAQFSAAIGCPRMTTWIPSWCELPKAEQRKIWLERFKRCAGILARSNVRFGLEFLGPLHLRRRGPHEFIWRMDEMLAFAADCGPNVGVLLDSWHWHHAGGTAKDIESTPEARIVHVQVADSQDLPPEKIVDSERLMPGEGVADLTGFFQALRKIGYAGGVSPEVFGRGLKEMDPKAGAKLGLETTLAVMKKAGVV
ncbi:MAG: sugar phosphate isomerase/epimerase family protein [Bryobacteraceae bacterium]